MLLAAPSSYFWSFRTSLRASFCLTLIEGKFRHRHQWSEEWCIDAVPHLFLCRRWIEHWALPRAPVGSRKPWLVICSESFCGNIMSWSPYFVQIDQALPFGCPPSYRNCCPRTSAAVTSSTVMDLKRVPVRLDKIRNARIVWIPSGPRPVNFTMLRSYSQNNHLQWLLIRTFPWLIGICDHLIQQVYFQILRLLCSDCSTFVIILAICTLLFSHVDRGRMPEDYDHRHPCCIRLLFGFGIFYRHIGHWILDSLASQQCRWDEHC